MASLFDAIVLQNLSVLTRGYTLLPSVLLLGGPNAFIAGLRAGVAGAHLPRCGRTAASPLPKAPRSRRSDRGARRWRSTSPRWARSSSAGSKPRTSDGTREPRRWRALGPRRARAGPPPCRRCPGSSSSERERDAFIERYAPPPFAQPRFAAGERVRAFLGLDAGSTSTKGVLLAEDGAVLAKAYRLSLGNPIEDAVDIVARLRDQVEARRRTRGGPRRRDDRLCEGHPARRARRRRRDRRDRGAHRIREARVSPTRTSSSTSAGRTSSSSS